MTERHVHIDPIGGLAGDMFLGAALDAGLLSASDLERLLEGLAIEGPLGFETRRVRRGALTGLRFEVTLPAESPRRDYAEIRNLLDASELQEGVRARSQDLFRILAEAEGAIHGVPTEDVHFHEVGAIDSIVDFVGVAFVIEQTEATWSVGTLPMGTGSVETSHGEMPVPAPATAELLSGFRVVRRQLDAELVTPTAAAILRYLREDGLLTDGGEPGEFGRVGYGAGSRKREGMNNVARLLVVEREGDTEGFGQDVVVEIVCDVDDRSPEVLAYLADLLIERGALDVTRTPIHMKKGRAGTRVSVLAEPDHEEDLLDLLFREGLTLGVRTRRVPRRTLDRHQRPVETDYGTVRVKVGTWRGKTVRVDPEYEDCRQAAAEHSVPLRRVIEAAREEVSRAEERTSRPGSGREQGS